MGGSTSKAVATGVGRKLKKPFEHYKALDRAHKVIEQEQSNPKRAPMNIKKVDIPASDRKRKLKEIEEMQKEDLNYLKLFKQIKISSTDPKDFKPAAENMHSHSRSATVVNSLPKFAGNVKIEDDKPLKGTAEITDIVDAISNHKQNPEDWTPAAIADHLQLREDDVKKFLKHYDLLDRESIFNEEDFNKSDDFRVKSLM